MRLNRTVSTGANECSKCTFPFRHPLFPLVAALFDKSEQATHNLDGSAQQSAVESFQADLSAFVQRLEQERKSVYTENRELDLLVSVLAFNCSN